MAIDLTFSASAVWEARESVGRLEAPKVPADGVWGARECWAASTRIVASFSQNPLPLPNASRLSCGAERE